MTKRVLMQQNRILIAKPGYEATVGLGDDGKIFDSDWDFTGTVWANGYYVDPSVSRDAQGANTDNGSAHVIFINKPFNARETAVCLTAVPAWGTTTISYPNGSGGMTARSMVALTARYYAAQGSAYYSWYFSGNSIVISRKVVDIYDNRGRVIGQAYERMNWKYTVFSI